MTDPGSTATDRTAARLAVLIENVNAGVALIDEAGRFCLFNQRFLKMFGLEPESSIKNVNDRDWSAWTVCDENNRVLEVDEHPVRKAVLTRQTVKDLLVGVRNPGAHDLVWMLVSAAPLFDSEGRLENVICTYSDVTERRRAEEAVRESEARFRSVLDSSLDCIYRFNLQSGHYEYISPAAERIVGYTPAELSALGTAAALERIHPADAPALLAALEQLEAAGRVEVEYRQVTKTGGYAWLSNRMTLSRDPDGRPLYRDGTIRDITERKLQEQRLEKLSRLYAVLSKVNENIVRTRLPADLYWRVCRILAEDGGHPLVWIGMARGNDVVPVAWAGPSASYLEEIRIEVLGELGAGPTGTSVREGRLVVNDDFDSNPTTLPWREAARSQNLRASAAFPLRREGSVIGALTLYASEPGTFDPEQVALLDALSADVSYALDAMGRENALRESEQSLREMDQRKNEFLAMLSHELRNPLAPIRNSLYIIDRAAPGSEQARRAHAVIDRQIAHVTRLVDDLLDLTRITRGKIQLHREILDLNSLAVRSVEDHRSVCVANGVGLEVQPATGPLWVNGDHTRLSQVIGNLLQNSAKFTPSGGRISLSVGRDASRRSAILRVQDTGVGIAPELLPRLFEPFTQAEATLDRSQGGLGLGLSLVRGLVELHGGSVSAASDGANQGATFIVELPLEMLAEETQDTAPSAGPDGRSRRVLVIEDNVDAADSLRDALELAGHVVEVAYTGAAGIEKAAAFHPDVVLCDIGLPRMDGYEVARTLRGSPSHRGVLLIALTGYAQPDEIARSREAGFDAHLAKPASIETIERTLADTSP